MKKIVAILVILMPSPLIAQDWEFGGMGGISVYGGDLAKDVIAHNEIHAAYGGLLRHNFNPYITLKSNIYYGTISGDDANQDKQILINRNLSFQSTILDIGAQAEINFSGFETTDPKKRTSLYGLIGLSVFRFNPKTEFNNRMVELQPLGTEGQGTTSFDERDKYALTQISIPIGGGIKHAFSKHWSIGFEAGLRKTFTDYLDDVSKTYVSPEVLTATHGKIAAKVSNRSGEVLDEPWQVDSKSNRGNSTLKDWYYFAGVTLTYTVVPDRCYQF